MEQLADFAPMVQILDVLEPQMVDQLVEVLMLFDAAIPEQVVAVPKISCPSRPLRGSCRHADGGAVGGSTNGRGACRCHSSSWRSWFKVSSQYRVLLRFYGGHHPGQSSFQPSVEQIVDIPGPGGGLQDFLPDQGSAASSAVLLEEPFQCFFALWAEKSAKVTRQSSARVQGTPANPS